MSSQTFPVVDFQACKGEGGQSDPQASPAKRKRTASPAVKHHGLFSVGLVLIVNIWTEVVVFAECCRFVGSQLHRAAHSQLVPDAAEASGRKTFCDQLP